MTLHDLFRIKCLADQMSEGQFTLLVSQLTNGTMPV